MHFFDARNNRKRKRKDVVYKTKVTELNQVKSPMAKHLYIKQLMQLRTVTPQQDTEYSLEQAIRRKFLLNIN